MKLTHLSLRQFRCFEGVDLDLMQPGQPMPLQVALLVGPNGSGKSSVLEAISGFLTFVSPLYGGDVLRAEDVRNGAAGARIEMGFRDLVGQAATARPQDFVGAVHLLPRTTEIEGVVYPPGLVGEAGQATDLSSWLPWVAAPERRTTGMVVSLETHRFVPPVPVAGPDRTRSVEHRCAGALTRSIGRQTFAARFGHLKQWIVNLDYERLRAKVERNEELPTWEMLRDALAVLFDPFRLARVSPTMDVLFSTPDGEVPLEALSSGFQSLFVVISELVMRLSLCTSDPSRALLQEGVCLIDEIDAHLHPRWQKRVIPALRRLFPNVQFVMTTHSPLVVSTAMPSEIFQFSTEGLTG